MDRVEGKTATLFLGHKFARTHDKRRLETLGLWLNPCEIVVLIRPTVIISLITRFLWNGINNMRTRPHWTCSVVRYTNNAPSRRCTPCLPINNASTQQTFDLFAPITRSRFDLFHWVLINRIAFHFGAFISWRTNSIALRLVTLWLLIRFAILKCVCMRIIWIELIRNWGGGGSKCCRITFTGMHTCDCNKRVNRVFSVICRRDYSQQLRIAQPTDKCICRFSCLLRQRQVSGPPCIYH